MSKQDRQGVRKPADLEQKYAFGSSFAELRKKSSNNADQLGTQKLTFSQFVQVYNSTVEGLKETDALTHEQIQQLIEQNTQLTEQNAQLREKFNALNTALGKYWETVYPVGSIYVSASSASPATLFGGTWEQLKDRFLLAAGDSYAAGSTGGEAAHTLSIPEMPNHDHAVKLSYTQSGLNNAWCAGNFAVSYSKYADNPWPEGEVVGNGGSGRFGTTASVGDSEPHNNMPPYLAVFVWQRTA